MPGTVRDIRRGHEEQPAARRRLADGRARREWDVLLWEHAPQAADAVVLELHRAFVDATGEYRAGPVVPAFEGLWVELVGETARLKQAEITHRIDRFIHDEALALFLCAPQALYAVNKHVDFTPHRTTFELAQTRARRALVPPLIALRFVAPVSEGGDGAMTR